jgi:hypothetical protein
VGLKNIRNRLQSAYGDEHRFEVRAAGGSGFTVVIELPYEPAEDDGDPAGAPAAASKRPFAPAAHESRAG